MRVVVTRDVIWLKRLHFQPNVVTGVLELDTTEDFGHDGDTPEQNNLPHYLGGEVTWSDPVETENKNVPVGNCNLHVHDAMVSSRYL